MTSSPLSRWTTRLVGVLVLLALCVGPTPASYAAPPASPRADARPATRTATLAPGRVTVLVTRIGPAVSDGSQPIWVTVTVDNRTDQPLPATSLRLFTSTEPLTSRSELAAWLDTQTPRPVEEQRLTQAEVPELPPHTAVQTVAVIPAGALGSARVTEVRPLRLDLVSVERLVARRRSVVTLQGDRPDPTPLHTALVVPLTMPADLGFYSQDEEIRASRWESLLGGGGTVPRLLTAAGDRGVTWAVDPTLTDPLSYGVPALEQTTPPDEPPAEGEPSPTVAVPSPSSGSTGAPLPTNATATPVLPSPTTPPAGVPPVSDVGTASRLAADLRGALATRSVVTLPASDVDVAHLVGVTGGDALLSRALARPAPSPTQPLVVWPVSDIPLDVVARAADAAELTDLPVLTGNPADVEAAQGTLKPLLVDRALGRDLAFAEVGDAGATVQRLLAELSVIQAARPFAERTLVVAVPRSTRMSPEVLAQVLDSWDSAGWVTVTPLDDIRRSSYPPALPGAGMSERAVPVSASPVSASITATTERMLTNLAAGRALTDSSRAGVPEFLDDQVLMLSSTRWRSNARRYRELSRELAAQSRRIQNGITVAGTRVNFFSSRGPLGVTITNRLDVEVHDLTVELRSGSARLHFDQSTEVISIGPRSRQRVTVDAVALANGQAPVTVRLSAPGGAEVNRPARLTVRINTARWLYAVLGGVVVLLVGAGVWRMRRAGRRTA